MGEWVGLGKMRIRKIFLISVSWNDSFLLSVTMLHCKFFLFLCIFMCVLYMMFSFLLIQPQKLCAVHFLFLSLSHHHPPPARPPAPQDSNRTALASGKQNAGVIPPDTQCAVTFEASRDAGGACARVRALGVPEIFRRPLRYFSSDSFQDIVVGQFSRFFSDLFCIETSIHHPETRINELRLRSMV